LGNIGDFNNKGEIMEAKLLSNGNLLIPFRVEGENGELGDTVKEVEPGTPEYEEWLPFIEKS
jgi:hypothetical protein